MKTRRRWFRMWPVGLVTLVLAAGAGCQNMLPRACFKEDDCVKTPVNGTLSGDPQPQADPRAASAAERGASGFTAISSVPGAYAVEQPS